MSSLGNFEEDCLARLRFACLESSDFLFISVIVFRCAALLPNSRPLGIPKRDFRSLARGGLKDFCKMLLSCRLAVLLRERNASDLRLSLKGVIKVASDSVVGLVVPCLKVTWPSLSSSGLKSGVEA